MQLTSRRNPYKIPRALYSEKYNELPLKQQRAVLRTLHKTHKGLYLRAHNLGKGIENLNEEIAKLKTTGLLPVGQKDRAQYMQQLEQGTSQIFESKKILASELKKFVAYAKPYFGEFNPLEFRSTPKAENYIERMVYETAGEIRYLTEIYYRALNNLRLLKPR
ncbi:MAG: hypothetical protein HYW05_00390 [Candidatus Diapherotrites archaeon]|nr:hypothetical protein [Candidatus Diapherotrites archaeon]